MKDNTRADRTAQLPRCPSFPPASPLPPSPPPASPLPRLPAPPPSQPLIPARHRHRRLRRTLAAKGELVRGDEVPVLRYPAKVLNVDRLLVDVDQVEHRGAAPPLPVAVGAGGADGHPAFNLPRAFVMV